MLREKIMTHLCILVFSPLSDANTALGKYLLNWSLVFLDLLSHFPRSWLSQVILWLESPHLLLALVLVTWPKPPAFLHRNSHLKPPSPPPHLSYCLSVKDAICLFCKSKFVRYAKTRRDMYVPATQIHIPPWKSFQKYSLLHLMWTGVLSRIRDDRCWATYMRRILCTLQCLLNIICSKEWWLLLPFSSSGLLTGCSFPLF